MAEQLPPGRAGRLWLIGRLRAARRAVDLLERKEQLLRVAVDEQSIRRRETLEAWERAAQQAGVWALRSGMLGGVVDGQVVAAPVAQTASVEITARTTVGVGHPGEARCRLAEPVPAAFAAANAALAPSARAHRAALEAAAAHAVADRSWRALDAELGATRRRLRAIRRHRVPALEEALRTLVLALDELERAERLTGRWARRRGA